MKPNETTRTPRRVRRLLLQSVGVAGLMAAVTGCERSIGTHPITDVRDHPADGIHAPRQLALEERLRAGHGGAEMDAHGGEPAAGGISWDYGLPAGWELLSPAPMRQFGFRVAGNADAECTFSTSGGDLLSNVNRWRKQMSAQPLDAAAVEALPRRTFLGRPAAVIEIEGAYVGMRGDKRLSGFKLLGLVAQLPETGAFLKMVGPAALVDVERERFFDLATSIRMRVGESGTGGGGTSREPAPASPKPTFQWTVPDGWEKQADRSVRLVTFRPTQAPQSEVYLTLLSGNAGGVEANVNLWSGQVDGEPLSSEQIAALPRAKILGREATFVTIEGRSGAEAGGKPEMLLGMILPFGDFTIFLKMRGPRDEVRGEQERFRAFAESFRE